MGAVEEVGVAARGGEPANHGGDRRQRFSFTEEAEGASHGGIGASSGAAAPWEDPSRGKVMIDPPWNRVAIKLMRGNAPPPFRQGTSVRRFAPQAPSRIHSLPMQSAPPRIRSCATQAARTSPRHNTGLAPPTSAFVTPPSCRTGAPLSAPSLPQAALAVSCLPRSTAVASSASSR
ncbi:hypothetical protein ZWY2020_028492 [Hordeum vulgare]|nr:hypothetical protein ZWY2020_028492 [Hordeum vulgare]